MATPPEELFEIADRLSSAANPPELKVANPSLKKLESVAQEIGRSFSGSWLGYHSKVYYADLQSPPPGAHFSQEWGLKDLFGDMGSRGDWREFDGEEVKNFIRSRAKNPDLKLISKASERAKSILTDAKSEIASMFSADAHLGQDEFLKDLKNKVEKLEALSPSEISEIICPKGNIMTRDMIAMGQGTRVPPHIAIQADVASIRTSFEACGQAAEICRKMASHLERRGNRARTSSRVGTNVFIGHGRSLAWRELKDFIDRRLKLPWDEFNRIPVAGITNVARLSEMLDASAIAFVIMTAEDALADGETQARMNVIHEAGLFQGRLGFTKAIILLEEGCKEFSNVQGLGQIRFPKGKISAAFEEVRLVLEREGLLE